MKILLTFILMVFYYYSFAQCNLKTGKEPFTGVKTRSSNYASVGTCERQGIIRFKLTEYIDSDSIVRLNVSIKRMSSRCFGISSKILINTGDTIITLKLSGQDNCGRHLDNYADLSLNDIKILEQNKMVGIRVNYEKGYDDFYVEDSYVASRADYFSRTLECFEKRK
jgi:hypothetical protein